MFAVLSTANMKNIFCELSVWFVPVKNFLILSREAGKEIS